MTKFDIGTKFKGLISKETFEIIGIKKADNGEEYYSVKHLKTGNVYSHSTSFVEHLQIELL